MATMRRRSVMKVSFAGVASRSFAILAGILITLGPSSASANEKERCTGCGPAPCCTILGTDWCGCPWGDDVAPIASYESSVDSCLDSGTSATDDGTALASFPPEESSSFTDDAICS
jgi:hypothetical protein